jgi:hypothetical protein
MWLIYAGEIIIVHDNPPTTWMHVSVFRRNLKISSLYKSGFCIPDHSGTIVSTSSLLWNVPRWDTFITDLGVNVEKEIRHRAINKLH